MWKSSRVVNTFARHCIHFIEFNDLLVDPFLGMLEYSFISGNLLRLLREADITLILKKGKCPEDCSGYTQNALLNQEVKLLSKIKKIVHDWRRFCSQLSRTGIVVTILEGS